MIDERYDAHLARFFSTKVLLDLVEHGESALIFELVKLLDIKAQLPASATYRDLYSYVYKRLKKNYRNEYIYKNAVAKKLFLERHKLSESFMLQEFRVSNCKADTVILNGTSNVYEIKSELDSIDRLARQIEAYTLAFDKVHVISAPTLSSKVEKILPKHVGIIEYTQKGALDIIREAKSGRKNVLPEVIFDSLQKREYSAILKKTYGELPRLPNTLVHREYKKLFSNLSPHVAHDEMVTILKKRGDCKWVKDFVKDTPVFFKALALKTNLKPHQISRVTELLNQTLPSI